MAPNPRAATTASRGLRYLCLTDRYQLEADIDTWWTRIVGDRTIWGPDLQGWDPQRTLDQNLVRRFGALEGFDAVFLSHAFSTCGAKYAPPSPAVMAGKPTVVFLHEVLDVERFEHPGHRPMICDVSRIDIVLHAYAESEMDPYYRARSLALARETDGRLARQAIEHLPHHVRCDLFFPPADGDAARDIDVLLVGRCDHPPGLYPLRARWAQLIRDGHWSNAVHVPTPYGRQERWSAAERRAQERTFADLLRRARIVLSCSSHWRYMLGKFTEIPACDAFLISDVPTHLPQPFVQNMGVVSTEMSDAELVEIVDYWLRNAGERRRRAVVLGAYVREHLSMTMFWTRVDDAVVRWSVPDRPG